MELENNVAVHSGFGFRDNAESIDMEGKIMQSLGIKEADWQKFECIASVAEKQYC